MEGRGNDTSSMNLLGRREGDDLSDGIPMDKLATVPLNSEFLLGRWEDGKEAGAEQNRKGGIQGQGSSVTRGVNLRCKG